MCVNSEMLQPASMSMLTVFFTTKCSQGPQKFDWCGFKFSRKTIFRPLQLLKTILVFTYNIGCFTYVLNIKYTFCVIAQQHIAYMSMIWLYRALYLVSKANQDKQGIRPLHTRGIMVALVIRIAYRK